MQLPELVLQKLPEWKVEHGDVLFKEEDGVQIFFRGATLSEFEAYEHLREKDVNYAEEFLVERCILYRTDPTDSWLDRMNVSFVPSLVKEILLESKLQTEQGFKDAIDKARTEASTPFGIGTALIAKTFGIDPDSIRHFSMPKFCRYVALAEQVTSHRLTIEKKKSKRPRSVPAEGKIPPMPPGFNPTAPAIDFAAENALDMAQGIMDPHSMM